jgi:undecaprenyl pyrophosphate phosphatase UppP
MLLFQALILAGVQTIPDFVSISSSAHPFPVRTPTGRGNKGLTFDAAVDAGTVRLIFVWAPSLACVIPKRPFAQCYRGVPVESLSTRNEKTQTW